MIPVDFDKLEKGVEYYCIFKQLECEFGENEPTTILDGKYNGEQSFIKICTKQYKKKCYKKLRFENYNIIRFSNTNTKTIANFHNKDFIKDKLYASVFPENKIKIYLPETEIIQNRSILRQYIRFFNEKTKTNIGDNIKNIIGEFLFKD